jgi:DNA-binding GntR family transcriptional regulator
MEDVELSASDRAYNVLVRRIATCELRAGAPFVEREEAARLGMSRTPFRDALNRLALEGLVSRVPKRGTFVSLLDPRDISDNMSVREAIEVEMARRVIEGGRAAQLDLDSILEEQRRAIAAGDHRAFLAADETFHMSLVAAAGNARAVEAARRAWLHVNRVRYLEPMTTAAMRRARRDHMAIARAVHDGSAARTQEAVRSHLEEPLHRLLSDHARRYPASFTAEALLELARTPQRRRSRPSQRQNGLTSMEVSGRRSASRNGHTQVATVAR